MTSPTRPRQDVVPKQQFPMARLQSIRIPRSYRSGPSAPEVLLLPSGGKLSLPRKSQNRTPGKPLANLRPKMVLNLPAKTEFNTKVVLKWS